MARGLEPVGFWDRLGAAVLDAGLPFLLALLVAGSRGAEALGVYLVLVFLTYWLMLGTLGGTIGMLVLGLVVVDKDGRRIGLWRAGARMAGWALSWLLLGMGHLLIASRRDGRGLHDLLAGTMVVYDREFQALQSMPATELRPGGSPGCSPAYNGPRLQQGGAL